jgi:hypothetical protein
VSSCHDRQTRAASNTHGRSVFEVGIQPREDLLLELLVDAERPVEASEDTRGTLFIVVTEVVSDASELIAEPPVAATGFFECPLEIGAKSPDRWEVELILLLEVGLKLLGEFLEGVPRTVRSRIARKGTLQGLEEILEASVLEDDLMAHS